MGGCWPKSNKNNEVIQINKKIKIDDESNKKTEIENKNDRIKECIIQPSTPFEKIDPYLSNVLKSICKITIVIELGTIIIGTGFLLKFYIDQEIFYFLISNEHVIKNDIILNNKIIIYISYDNEFKDANINLGNKKRYMKSFTDIELDITIVEIIDEDNISKDYFLFPELGTMINNELINNNIYIPQFVKGKELVNARGIIKEINNNEFTHLANTEKGSSGSPIFLENSNKVIGIHKEGNKDKTENYGDFIYPAINIIKNDIREKRNNGKNKCEDDKDEFKNNISNGKGIKYYSNGNILYEDDLIKGTFEGNGKYIWEDGKYYIGQFKNNLPNGKGNIYYSNGKILYDGDFINGKREGKGKYIWEEGEYYKGQWKDGLRNGKGIEYYSNGNIKYDGDYINDKYEGNGKYIYEDGKYYKGQWKNGLRNGKGILYYSNGNIMYEGDFINDKREGKGKYIWEDGEYCIGQWKNNLMHGKGILYYSNGKKNMKVNLLMISSKEMVNIYGKMANII